MCHIFLIWDSISILFFLDCFVILLCMVFILATQLEQKTSHICYISNSFKKLLSFTLLYIQWKTTLSLRLWGFFLCLLFFTSALEKINFEMKKNKVICKLHDLGCSRLSPVCNILSYYFFQCSFSFLLHLVFWNSSDSHIGSFDRIL